MESFFSLPAVWQAFFATLFTWGVTALGAGLVFVFKKENKPLLDATLGFAAGVMIAASFWSLLLPAEEKAIENGHSAALVVTGGFLFGGFFLFLGDRLFSRLLAAGEGGGSRRRCALLIFSITLHNIPEGLAIGVAFGSADARGALIAAWVLALGIGIQNFPEGSAVSVPLRREGKRPLSAFLIGQASGMVEPAAAVVGALAAQRMQAILPFCLAFAAGAMIYVVAQELIPESQSGGKKDLTALTTLFGFALMTALDVALG